jgi:hypothetical protein
VILRFPNSNRYGDLYLCMEDGLTSEHQNLLSTFFTKIRYSPLHKSSMHSIINLVDPPCLMIGI